MTVLVIVAVMAAVFCADAARSAASQRRRAASAAEPVVLPRAGSLAAPSQHRPALPEGVTEVRGTVELVIGGGSNGGSGGAETTIAAPWALTLPPPNGSSGTEGAAVAAGDGARRRHPLCLALTHGSLGDLDSGELPLLAGAAAAAGVPCVRLTCREPDVAARSRAMQELLRRAAAGALHPALADCARWAVGGRSLGARAAARVAYCATAADVDGMSDGSGNSSGGAGGEGDGALASPSELAAGAALRAAGVAVVGAVLSAYPAHAPGDAAALRDRPLTALRRAVPMLLLRGTRDPHATPGAWARLRAALAAAGADVAVAEVGGGDHWLRVAAADDAPASASGSGSSGGGGSGGAPDAQAAADAAIVAALRTFLRRLGGGGGAGGGEGGRSISSNGGVVADGGGPQPPARKRSASGGGSSFAAKDGSRALGQRVSAQPHQGVAVGA